ncbi:MAG: hypothetical protein P8016_16005 [Sedimentisphaerales bacterium]
MLKKCTGLGIKKISSLPGRPEIVPHLVEGDGDNFIDVKDANAPLEILQSVFNAVVDLLSCPYKAVFKVLEDINLPDSLLDALFPSPPIPVIVKEVFSGAGLKDIIPGFRP